MNLIDIAEPSLIFKPEDNVSKVISKMFNNRKSEAVILEHKTYKGMIVSGDLTKRKINMPQKTKIKKFITHVPLISPETQIKNIINLILVNNYKSVPLEVDGNFFIITKLNILKSLKNDSTLKNKKAKNVMVMPFCIGSNDSITTAMSILRDMKISRLPVIDRNGRIDGLINTIDLLKADTDRKRTTLGEKSGETLDIRKVLISSLMQKNISITRPDSSLRDVINLMIDKKISTVPVQDKKKLVGIITPKLILQLFMKSSKVKEIENVYVRISGIQKEDMFIKSIVDEEIRNQIRKLGRIIPIDYIVLHVDKHRTTGKRTKYSLKARIITKKGFYFADDHAWDITKAVRGALKKLEKEIIKKTEKQRAYKRAP